MALVLMRDCRLRGGRFHTNNQRIDQWRTKGGRLQTSCSTSPTRDLCTLQTWRVQKLLYYAHGWYLAAHGSALVADGFEAWEHGPVVRSIYVAFKQSGDRAITKRAEILNVLTGEVSVAKCEVPDVDRKLLADVLEGYGHLHAFELSRMTHEHGSPWDKVWNSQPGQITPGMRISDNLIRAHFSNLRFRRLN
jgi:uncharacterized phage-associated protein